MSLCPIGEVKPPVGRKTRSLRHDRGSEHGIIARHDVTKLIPRGNRITFTVSEIKAMPHLVHPGSEVVGDGWSAIREHHHGLAVRGVEHSPKQACRSGSG